MNYYDCSTPLHAGLVTWPGETAPERTVVFTMEKDGVEVSHLVLGSHSGTHIDAPRHFTNISTGVDDISLETLIGPATVVDLTQVEGRLIEPEHLSAVDWDTSKRLLFKTSNSTRGLMDESAFTEDYVSLSVATAELLVEKGIVLVGVDYLSVEKKGNPGHPVHVALLSAGIVNIEGVRLTDVPPGDYELIALPLLVKGSDGAPTRVVLRRTA